MLSLPNRAGKVAGWYGATSSFQGFVRSAKGVITPFMVPGQIDTQYVSINRAGVVAGSYRPSSPSEHGFIRFPDGAMTTIDPPGSLMTQVTGINDTGVTIGTYSENTASGAFLRIPEFDCDDDNTQ